MNGFFLLIVVTIICFFLAVIAFFIWLCQRVSKLEDELHDFCQEDTQDPRQEEQEDE